MPERVVVPDEFMRAAKPRVVDKNVDAVVYGTVVPSVIAPNIAREISLMPMLPRGCEAYTVSRACASANQAITDAADQIALGQMDVAIAGGSESLSNIPILHSQGFAETLVLASKAKTLPQRIRALMRLRPKDLIPITPAIAERRAAHVDAAARIAARLFVEKPNALRRRLATMWKVGR